MQIHQSTYRPEQSLSSAGFHLSLDSTPVSKFANGRWIKLIQTKKESTHKSVRLIHVVLAAMLAHVSPGRTKYQLLQYVGCPACVFCGGKVLSIVVVVMFHV